MKSVFGHAFNAARSSGNGIGDAPYEYVFNAPNHVTASSPDSSTFASTAGTRNVRLAPLRMAPASAIPSTSRVITLGMPWWMPNCAYDVPPTWNRGIDTMFLSPSSKSKPSCPLMVWAIRLAWVNATPLGLPVVPDEYMMMPTSPGSTSAERSTGVAAASIASYSSPSAPSGVTSMTCSTLGSRSRILSTEPLSSLPTINTLAPESLST